MTLPLADYRDLPLHTVKGFAWGNKPGFIRRMEDGGYLALVGVCTHLDCNVTFVADQRRFFCACHEGWYDEDGVWARRFLEVGPIFGDGFESGTTDAWSSVVP